MKHGQRIILTALCGGVALLAAELVQTKQIASRLQAEGVTLQLDVPLVGRVSTRLQLPAAGSSSSSPAVVLPADVKTIQDRMHKVAIGAAVAAGLLTFIVASE